MLVDTVPEPRQRHGAVPGEGVPHPRVAGHGRRAAEEYGDGHGRQADDTAAAAAEPLAEGGVQGLRDGVPAGVVGRVQERRDVGHHGCQGHQVNPAEDARQRD